MACCVAACPTLTILVLFWIFLLGVGQSHCFARVSGAPFVTKGTAPAKKKCESGWMTLRTTFLGFLAQDSTPPRKVKPKPPCRCRAESGCDASSKLFTLPLELRWAHLFREYPFLRLANTKKKAEAILGVQIFTKPHLGAIPVAELPAHPARLGSARNRIERAGGPPKLKAAARVMYVSFDRAHSYFAESFFGRDKLLEEKEVSAALPNRKFVGMADRAQVAEVCATPTWMGDRR